MWGIKEIIERLDLMLEIFLKNVPCEKKDIIARFIETKEKIQELLTKGLFFSDDWHRCIQELAEKITRETEAHLDKTETERLGRLLTLELNLRQGNISPLEYKKSLKNEFGGNRK